jgi:hypothetical protein
MCTNHGASAVRFWSDPSRIEPNFRRFTTIEREKATPMERRENRAKLQKLLDLLEKFGGAGRDRTGA